MNPDEFATRMTAPVALVVGLLVCFLGYRLLKLSLAEGESARRLARGL